VRLGWDAFPPTPPGLGFPFLSLQSPLFLSPHLPLWSSAPFFMGGGLDWRSKARQGRQASLSLLSDVCCSAVHPHGERARSVTRSTFCSHTTPSPASLINLQCSPTVSEYFVFVQSGEFPASCMCQGVCASGSLPVSLLHAARGCLPFHLTHRCLPPTSILLLSRFIQRDAMPVNQCYISKQKCLRKGFCCGHRGGWTEECVYVRSSALLIKCTQ
jgi:hypothetical protein